MEGLTNTDEVNTGIKHQQHLPNSNEVTEDITPDVHLNSSVHVPHEAEIQSTQPTVISSTHSEIKEDAVTVNGVDLVRVNDTFTDLKELNDLEEKMAALSDQTDHDQDADSGDATISPPNITRLDDPASVESTTAGSCEDSKHNSTLHQWIL